jgi:hypothetical protein
MQYDKELIAHKLDRWDRFITDYHLPEWDSIPDLGLYMDQVVVLLAQYLNFIPAMPGGKESFVTSSTINNYVRLKIMPAPVKRKYFRVHIAYLIMILTMKQSISISDVQKIIPADIPEEEVRATYQEYSEKFRHIALFFNQQVQDAAEDIRTPDQPGEAAVSAYYAGDYFTMCDAQADSVDLQFYYPDETNYFIDAMCIPSCCQDQELAECFINFMLSREAAVANAEYIYYASPNQLVYDDPEYIDDMGEDTMAILYPDIGSFRDAYNRSAYRNLDQDTLTYVNTLWETLKIN